MAALFFMLFSFLQTSIGVEQQKTWARRKFESRSESEAAFQTFLVLRKACVRAVDMVLCFYSVCLINSTNST